MQFKQVCALLVMTACNAAVDGNGPGGGGDDTPGGPTAGNGDVQFLKTMVRDERADRIDFTHREPLHSHYTTDSAAFLGGTDCPDVYQYGYVQAHNEVTPNELAWRIEANDAAEYRVRGESEAVERDWAPVAADGSIVLGRDVTSGKHYLDVQIGEDLATTCWNHHVLGAPVEVKPAGAVANGGLMAMSFAEQSPISQLIETNPFTVPVLEQRFIHHAPVPVRIEIDLSAPTGSFMRRVVDDFVAVSTSTAGYQCVTDLDCITDEPVDPADSSDAGPLASGEWSLKIVDEVANKPLNSCTVQGLRATCDLPAATEAHAYRAVLRATKVRDLATSPGAIVEEHLFGSTIFTGERLEQYSRCSKMITKTINEVEITSCVQTMTYQRIRALDGARLAIDPVTFTLAAAPDAQSPAFPLAYVPQPDRVGALSWDAGDADLPGPH